MDANLYLINGLVAAALGAGTNEIAIVCILRYILPKKKSEIARRIRDLVAQDLLSPEKMRSKLDEPGIDDLLVSTIDSALEEILARDLPAPENFLRDHVEEIDRLAARMRDSALHEFARRIAAPEFMKETLEPFLRERWRTLRTRPPTAFLPGHAAAVSDLARTLVLSCRESPVLRDETERLLQSWIDSRLRDASALGELLPPGALAALEEFAAEQTGFIVDQIGAALEENGVQNAIVNGIMNAIRQELDSQGLIGNIKGVFVDALQIENDVRGVAMRLPEALRQNFRMPENAGKLAELLRVAVGKFLRRGGGELLDAGGKRRQFINALFDQLWTERVWTELADRIATAVDGFLAKPLAETAELFGVGGDLDGELLRVLAERCRRMLASATTRDVAARQFDELYREWKRRPVGRLKRFVTATERERVARIVAAETRLLLRERLDEFTERSGVWDIITESVEQYDDRELEALIVRLARAELRWVTALGGIIGFGVGLLQTFAYSALR